MSHAPGLAEAEHAVSRLRVSPRSTIPRKSNGKIRLYFGNFDTI